VTGEEQAMRGEARAERSDADVAAIAETLEAWRQQHPRATLTEIEQELDRQWRRVRADMVARVALAAAQEDAACPACGASLIRRGQQERTLLTDGEQPITLRRAYMTCPACGRGLFPPG
jgi:YgiT-type zinc finger domain-containing protein